MQINFTQGIISYKKFPLLLSLNNGNIDLNADSNPVSLAFSHGNVSYLFKENKKVISAWEGPFLLNTRYFLYWDIDLFTAKRTFKKTILQPQYGPQFPSSPSLDQHFFNTTTNKMYYWNGQGWIESLRVFAGNILNSKITINGIGSQANLQKSTTVNEIIFDVNGLPIKKFTEDSFEFLTENNSLDLTVNNLLSVNLEQLDIRGVSDNFIPKNYCVIFDGKDVYGNPKVKKTSLFDTNNEACALTSETMFPGEVKQLITRGYIQDFRWYWNVPPLTPLFVGGDGEISLYNKNALSIQKIGYVVNLNTVFINFSKKISLLPP